MAFTYPKYVAGSSYEMQKLSTATRNELDELAVTTSLGEKLGTGNLYEIAENTKIVLDEIGVAAEDLTREQIEEVAKRVAERVDIKEELVFAVADDVIKTLVPIKDRPIVLLPGGDGAPTITLALDPLETPHVPVAHPGDLITAEAYNGLRAAVLATAKYANSMRQALEGIVEQINKASSKG